MIQHDTPHRLTRRFVPAAVDGADFAALEPLFHDLLNRPLDTTDQLRGWLTDYSELHSVVDEAGSRRYIDASCHTDDAEIQQRFMHFVTEVDPRLKPLGSKLQRRYLAAPARSAMEAQDPRLALLGRNWSSDVEIYRDENVPLETQVTRIVNDYDKVCGAQVVEFRGQTYTLQQMGRFLEETDRPTRREAWEATATRRLVDRERNDELFEKLLPLRHTIARQAGKTDFRAYMFAAMKRLDYTPDDCLRFHDAIEAVNVPIVRRLDDDRRSRLGVETLRPWDGAVDPQNRPPLRPFDPADIDGFVARTHAVFDRISPELGAQFDTLRRSGNLDLASRRGKRPGGYQASLNEQGSPFIFMNAAGLHRDVETMLHEGGHAFNFMAARAAEPLVFLRDPPMEFAEVASMSMELLGSEHIEVFYPDPAEARRAKAQQIEKVLRFFPWMAIIDAFQHWIYTHPDHSREQRTATWLSLMTRFGGQIDFTGHEATLASLWQRQTHIYHVPFYYVEYGIAQLGALQLWIKSLDDPSAALAGYRRALALGGSRPLPQLFAAAGIAFDFSEKTLRPLMMRASEELAALQ